MKYQHSRTLHWLSVVPALPQGNVGIGKLIDQDSLLSFVDKGMGSEAEAEETSDGVGESAKKDDV